MFLPTMYFLTSLYFHYSSSLCYDAFYSSECTSVLFKTPGILYCLSDILLTFEIWKFDSSKAPRETWWGLLVFLEIYLPISRHIFLLPLVLYSTIPAWIAEILKFTQIPHFSNYFCRYSELDCLSELTEMWSAVINLSGLLISKCIKYFTFSFPASFTFKKIIKLIIEHRLWAENQTDAHSHC